MHQIHDVWWWTYGYTFGTSRSLTMIAFDGHVYSLKLIPSSVFVSFSLSCATELPAGLLLTLLLDRWGRRFCGFITLAMTCLFSFAELLLRSSEYIHMGFQMYLLNKIKWSVPRSHAFLLFSRSEADDVGALAILPEYGSQRGSAVRCRVITDSHQNARHRVDPYFRHNRSFHRAIRGRQRKWSSFVFLTEELYSSIKKKTILWNWPSALWRCNS